jgi:hypothetical protein
MNFFRDGRLTSRLNVAPEQFAIGVVLFAYKAILKRFYDLDLPMDYSIVSTVQDQKTGLDRYFSWRFNPKFVDIRAEREPEPLTGEDQRRLFEDLNDLSRVYEVLPPQNFEFYGFTVFHSLEVTDQEALSALRLALIQRDTLVSQAGFDTLQQKLRILFRRKDLKLGIVSSPTNGGRLLQAGHKIGQSFVLDESCIGICSHIRGSVYERLLESGDPVIIEDLRQYSDSTPLEEGIVRQGIRNLVLLPLRFNSEMIGFLELGSPNPGDLNAVILMKMAEVLPLFAMATRRSVDELNTGVQAVIKEKFTAIHPSVEWRFRDAALAYLSDHKRSVSAELKPIVFKDVYPLYGLADIRGSSTHRTEAIRSDLGEQLTLVREVVHSARRFRALPILDELSYRIGMRLEALSSGLSSGDELAILDFLKTDVEPLFSTLAQYDGSVETAIRDYRAALDSHLQIVYRRRKEFEESVTQLNDIIGAYIEEEEAKAQEMYPHYFEKYKSDGVEYTIYIGGDIAEKVTFDPLYLRNLRLWQLLMMAGVARKVESAKVHLKVPLEATGLILVQNTPLAIRFRVDEKMFDVDGAYNVRYEIMKKRIDKAVVHGREERLTQPGQIAIVYSQPREAAEYRQYIEFLQARGFLDGQVESLELQDLQGVQGLRALRVKVNTQSDAGDAAALLERIEGAVKEMVQRAMKE